MGRPKTEAADYKNLLLRLPEDILEQCKARAKKDHRSLNAQVLAMLEKCLQETKEISHYEFVGSREH
jgi:hypothetical protein